MSNPLALDPTRTITLRKQFMTDTMRRFVWVRGEVEQLVGKDRAFETAPVINEPYQFAFLRNPDKVKAFRQWLQERVDAGILAVEDGLTDRPWFSKYVDSSYKQGALRSFNEFNAARPSKSKEFSAGRRSGFLTAFGQGEQISKLELLYTRAFEDLQGITSAMSSKLSVILTDGLANGKTSKQIARQMSKSIDGITYKRGLLLARTEVIRAHAWGQLDSYQALGIREVTAMVEIATAGDLRVCSRCEGLVGETFKIEDAYDVVPVHPDCRCGWQVVI